MILEIIVGAIASFLNGLLGALPAVSWTWDLSGLGQAVAVFKAWDAALPVGAMVSVIGVALLYQAASLIYHQADWIRQRIPFIGGG